MEVLRACGLHREKPFVRLATGNQAQRQGIPLFSNYRHVDR